MKKYETVHPVKVERSASLFPDLHENRVGKSFLTLPPPSPPFMHGTNLHLLFFFLLACLLACFLCSALFAENAGRGVARHQADRSQRLGETLLLEAVLDLRLLRGLWSGLRIDLLVHLCDAEEHGVSGTDWQRGVRRLQQQPHFRHRHLLRG